MLRPTSVRGGLNAQSEIKIIVSKSCIGERTCLVGVGNWKAPSSALCGRCVRSPAAGADQAAAAPNRALTQSTHTTAILIL